MSENKLFWSFDFDNNIVQKFKERKTKHYYYIPSHHMKQLSSDTLEYLYVLYLMDSAILTSRDANNKISYPNEIAGFKSFLEVIKTWFLDCHFICENTELFEDIVDHIKGCLSPDDLFNKKIEDLLNNPAFINENLHVAKKNYPII
jgi:hypothetical protein